MTATTLTVPTDAGPMPAHLWAPSSGRGPGVLLLQEIFGISRYVEQRARDLADAGYVVLAPEIFWRIGVTRVPEGPAMLEEALALLDRVDWPAAVADGAAGLETLRGLEQVEGRAAVVGFCFGGGIGFNVAAVADPDALVAYYGSAIPDLLDQAPQVTCPSLHHFGLADTYLPPEVVERIRTEVAGPDVVVETYPGADHAFDNPDLPMHDAAASALAWDRTLGFLADQLRPGA